MERLVVAAAFAQEEFEGVTHIHLPRRALEEGNSAGSQPETRGHQEVATSVEGEFAVERDVLIQERLVGAVQVAEGTAKVEVLVGTQHAVPQSTRSQVNKPEAGVRNRLRRAHRGVINTAAGLGRPLEVRAVDAALARAQIGTYHQEVGFFAIAAHLFSIRTRQTRLNGRKLGRTGFVAPNRSAQAEIIVTAGGYLLVVRDVIGIISVAFQHRRPLVAVVSRQTVGAVHHTRQGGVQVQRAHVELREVNVLGAQQGREQYRAERTNE